MSGGGGPATSTTTTGPPAWAQGKAQGGLDAIYNQLFPGGNIRPMPPGLMQNVAPFTQNQLQGFQGVQGMTGPATGLAGMGAGELGATLGGAYLDPNTNPWLAATANEATQGLVNQYRSATAPSLMAEGLRASGGGPGALAGSSGFQEQQARNQYDLGQNIGNVESNIYGGAYAQERQNQGNQLGLLAGTQGSLYAPSQQLLGTGTTQQQQNQNLLDTIYRNTLQGVNWPTQQAGQFGDIFNSLTGGSSVRVGPSQFTSGK